MPVQMLPMRNDPGEARMRELADIRFGPPKRKRSKNPCARIPWPWPCSICASNYGCSHREARAAGMGGARVPAARKAAESGPAYVGLDCKRESVVSDPGELVIKDKQINQNPKIEAVQVLRTEIDAMPEVQIADLIRHRVYLLEREDRKSMVTMNYEGGVFGGHLFRLPRVREMFLAFPRTNDSTRLEDDTGARLTVRLYTGLDA